MTWPALERLAWSALMLTVIAAALVVAHGVLAAMKRDAVIWKALKYALTLAIFAYWLGKARVHKKFVFELRRARAEADVATYLAFDDDDDDDDDDDELKWSDEPPSAADSSSSSRTPNGPPRSRGPPGLLQAASRSSSGGRRQLLRGAAAPPVAATTPDSGSSSMV